MSSQIINQNENLFIYKTLFILNEHSKRQKQNVTNENNEIEFFIIKNGLKKSFRMKFVK